MRVVLFFTLSLLAFDVSATPQRIVSINQCADELLLRLADPTQIVSVTHFVKNPATSWEADQARDIPGNQGHVEEVVAFAPDLVLVGDFNARSSVALLRDLGLNVEMVAHPRRLTEVFDQITRVAELVGHPERGRALITHMRSVLAAPASKPRLSAAVYQPNGFTTGRNSILDDVLRAAGLDNAAASWGAGEYSYFPMERLIAEAPDLLVLDPQSQQAPSLAHQVLKHPALSAFFSEVQTINMPPQAWSCGSHHLVYAVELLRQAKAQVVAKRGL